MTEVGKCPDIPKAITGTNGSIVKQQTLRVHNYAPSTPDNPNGGSVTRNDKVQIFDRRRGQYEDQFGNKKPEEDILPKGFFAGTPEKPGIFGFLKKKEEPVNFLKMDVDKTLKPCLQELVGDDGTVEEASAVKNADGKGYHFKFTQIPAQQKNPDDPIISITTEVSPNNDNK